MGVVRWAAAGELREEIANRRVEIDQPPITRNQSCAGYKALRHRRYRENGVEVGRRTGIVGDAEPPAMDEPFRPRQSIDQPLRLPTGRVGGEQRVELVR